MTANTLAKEASRTLSEKSVLPITLSLLFMLVGGVWMLAFKVAEFSNRIDALENVVSSNWTYHMAREGWAEFIRINPQASLTAPDITKIRSIYK